MLHVRQQGWEISAQRHARGATTSGTDPKIIVCLKGWLVAGKSQVNVVLQPQHTSFCMLSTSCPLRHCSFMFRRPSRRGSKPSRGDCMEFACVRIRTVRRPSWWVIAWPDYPGLHKSTAKNHTMMDLLACCSQALDRCEGCYCMH